MTALAGIWRFDGDPNAKPECQRMLRALEIYGRDGTALWSDDAIAIGRAVWRILPEDRFDLAPQVSPSGRYALVADIRLDNRAEILTACAQPASVSDAAVLLGAIERWGLDALARLYGDYAFALWDRRERRLTLARSPMSARPLHFHRGAGFIAFASMAKGLHALDAVPREADIESVADILCLMPQVGTRSPFKGIERVEGGSCVVISPSGVSTRTFWEPERRPLKLAHAADYVEGIRHHMDEAVRACLRGTQSVAAQLSGGLDSAAVTATAARVLADSGGQVIAFTARPRASYDLAVPRGTYADEWDHAAATAALYPNIQHVGIRPDGRTPLDKLDSYFHAVEQPMRNPCNFVWQSAIGEAARARGQSVLLTGDLGELSFSYGGGEALAELMAAARIGAWWRLAQDLRRKGMSRWRSILVYTAAPAMPQWAWRGLTRLMGGSIDPTNQTAISPGWISPGALRKALWERNPMVLARPGGDGFAMRLWLARRWDVGSIVKGAQAIWGLDVRDPTGDRRLLEFCLSIPTEHFAAGGIPRALARLAMTDRLPPVVLNDFRKGYQSADWHEAMTVARPAIADEVERIAADKDAGHLIDAAKLRKLIADWPSGGWERQDVFVPYRLVLLRAIAAGHFLRRVSGSNQ